MLPLSIAHIQSLTHDIIQHAITKLSSYCAALALRGALSGHWSMVIQEGLQARHIPYLFCEAGSNDGEDGWADSLPKAHRLPLEELCSQECLP